MLRRCLVQVSVARGEQNNFPGVVWRALEQLGNRERGDGEDGEGEVGEKARDPQGPIALEALALLGAT